MEGICSPVHGSALGMVELSARMIVRLAAKRDWLPPLAIRPLSAYMRSRQTGRNVSGAHEDGQGRSIPALIVFRPRQPGQTCDKTGGDNRLARENV
jgi:hypothetical protein